MSDALFQNTEAAPSDAAVKHALVEFSQAIRRHYSDRLVGLYLFGSRARGDHSPGSDVDVAVVLAGGPIDFWREKMMLADLAYEPIAASGIHLQGWPVPSSVWEQPDLHHNPSLIRAMRRDGRVIEDVAT